MNRLSNRFRQARNRFLGSLKSLQIRAQSPGRTSSFSNRKKLFFFVYLPPSCETIQLYLCSGFQKYLQGRPWRGGYRSCPCCWTPPGTPCYPPHPPHTGQPTSNTRLLIVHRLAVRLVRPAPQGDSAHWANSDEETGDGPQRMFTNDCKNACIESK